MTNPMRHNLKKGLAKKGVIESTERFVKLIYPLLESEASGGEPNSQAVYTSCDVASMGLTTAKSRLA